MSRRSGQAGQVFLRNGKWVGRYYVDVAGQPERRRVAVVLGLKSEMNKSEARRKLMEILHTAGVNSPAHLERCLHPPLTFGAVAFEWRQKRLPLLKPSTQYAAPMLIKNHLLPFFGEMALADIKTGTINEWLSTLSAKGLEPKTVSNLWKLFRSIANWHARQNDEQPRRWFPTLPTIPVGDPRWFTQDEAKRISEAAMGQYRVLFGLAAATGLRAGELFGLHVEDINFERGVIYVRRSVYRGQEVTPKSARSYRDVWIDSLTATMLREYLGIRRTGRVFQTRTGRPLDSKDVLALVLHPICDRLGIERGGLHSFRHGRVSHLQAMNVPPEFTKSQVGHSSLKTTSGYTHFSDEFSRETVERAAQSWTH